MYLPMLAFRVYGVQQRQRALQLRRERRRARLRQQQQLGRKHLQHDMLKTFRKMPSTQSQPQIAKSLHSRHSSLPLRSAHGLEHMVEAPIVLPRTSGTPPTAVDTTSRPTDAASTMAQQNASVRLALMKMSPCTWTQHTASGGGQGRVGVPYWVTIIARSQSRERSMLDSPGHGRGFVVGLASRMRGHVLTNAIQSRCWGRVTR